MASDAGLIRVYTVASDLGLHCDVWSGSTLWRLIWVYTVYLRPKHMTLGIKWSVLTSKIFYILVSTRQHCAELNTFYLSLTHIWLMDFSIPFNWMSPFPNLGVSGAFFYFCFILIEFPISKHCRPWLDAVFPLAFVAGWLQGHWWGFISRNYVVWPTFFLMNVFIAFKRSHFWFYIWLHCSWCCAVWRP